MKKIKFDTLMMLGLVAVAVVGLTLLVGGCGENAASQPVVAEQTVETDERIPVRLAPVEQKNLSLPVHAGGVLGSSAEQRLSFKIGGIIRKTFVDEGDMVRAGQVLAVLDKTEIDAQVEQARQGLVKSERDLGRVEGLYRDSSATLELLQNASTGRDVAKETYRIASFNQQYAEIRATKSGKIIKKLMNEGEITGPGMPVFVLFETGADDWVVNVNLSDRDWARINPGMPATVRMDAYPDVVFRGKVSELSPAADPSTGLYPVEIRVVPQGKRFAPGLFASVEITPSQTRAYSMAPIDALIEGNGKSAWVYTVDADGESVKKIPVTVGAIEGDKVLITGGLEGVKEVISAGAPYLTEKKKIKKL